jgi:ATP-grasp domain
MLFDGDDPAARQRDAEAVTQVLLRVGRLAELLPEISEADLNPVIVTGGCCRIPDARIRLQPRQPVDPFLRRLRT